MKMESSPSAQYCHYCLNDMSKTGGQYSSMFVGMAAL